MVRVSSGVNCIHHFTLRFMLGFLLGFIISKCVGGSQRKLDNGPFFPQWKIFCEPRKWGLFKFRDRESLCFLEHRLSMPAVNARWHTVTNLSIVRAGFLRKLRTTQGLERQFVQGHAESWHCTMSCYTTLPLEAHVDKSVFLEYAWNTGKAYRNQALELISICQLLSHIALPKLEHEDAELRRYPNTPGFLHAPFPLKTSYRICRLCDLALRSAADSGTVVTNETSARFKEATQALSSHSERHRLLAIISVILQNSAFTPIQGPPAHRRYKNGNSAATRQ
jgi:hypothetical protein